MKKKLRCSITVFLLVITTVFVTLLTTLADIMRVNWGKNVVARSSYLISGSGGECFADKDLFEKYGLYLFKEGVKKEDLTEFFNEYFAGNLDCKGQMSIKYDTPEIDMYYLGQKINGSFNNSGVIQTISTIMDVEACQKQQDSIVESFNRVEKMKTDLEKYYALFPKSEEQGVAFYSKIDKLCFEGVEFKVQGADFDRIYYDRFSLLTDDNWSVCDWKLQQRYEFPKNRELENNGAVSEIFGYMCDNWWFSFANEVFAWGEQVTENDVLVYSPPAKGSYENGLDYVYELNEAVCYVLKHFGTFLDSDKNGDLNAQLEYVCFGQKTDEENVRCMLEEIYKYRYTANLLSLVKEGKTSKDDMTKLAQKEAEYDVMTLWQGKCVKAYKNPKDFVTDLKMNDSQIAKKSKNVDSYAGDDGVSYDDYVTCRLYHVASFEMIYSRIIDVISYEMNSNLKYRCVQAWFKTEYSVEYTPTSIAGLFGIIENEGEILAKGQANYE